jgi:hypothetical protein
MARLVETYAAYNNGRELGVAFRERFDAELPEVVADEHQLVIVASELDPATERIVEYVAQYGVPVNAVFFRYFVDDGREYIARSWLLNPADPENRPRVAVARKPRALWNGHDFYVSFGEDEY